jgi:hypothetical protein
MLEDGALTWQDQYRMAEERQSALIARGTFSRDAGGREGPRDAPGGSHRASIAAAVSRQAGNRRNGQTRPCIYFNNGVCAQKADHSTNGILWKHVCRHCWSVDHVDKDWPLEKH